MTNTDDVMTDSQLATMINRAAADLNTLLRAAGGRGLRAEIDTDTTNVWRLMQDGGEVEYTQIKVKVWKPL